MAKRAPSISRRSRSRRVCVLESTRCFRAGRCNERGAIEWPGEIDMCPDALYLRMTGQQPEALFPTLRKRVTNA
jgi:hypothetical protein